MDPYNWKEQNTFDLSDLSKTECCSKKLLWLTDLQVLVYEETEYDSLTEDTVSAAQVCHSSFPFQPKLVTQPMIPRPRQLKICTRNSLQKLWNFIEMSAKVNLFVKSNKHCFT